MPSRRNALTTGACVIGSSLAGCLDALATDASVREVSVDLRNPDDQSHTFHLALELERGVLDWTSHSVEAGADEVVTIDPPEDASPVAVHGAVDDFAGSVDILGVDDLDDDFCLRFYFWYRHPTRERPQIAQTSDIEC